MNSNAAPPRTATLLSLTLLGACSSGADELSPAAPPALQVSTTPAPATPAEPQSPVPSRPAPATPVTSPLPAPSPQPHTVQGEVFSFEAGMVGGASINLWVQQGGFGYSYWWKHGPLRSDSAGVFQAPYLPDSSVTILAFASGYVQPCAVTAHLSNDLAVRVEMVPVSSLDAFNPPRPQLSTEPTLTGAIFEITATGPQPVAGASLWVEESMDVGMATTVSDRGGGFFLCNLGRAAWLYVSKDGYEARSIGPIDVSESQVLEIELKRS